MEGNFSDSLKFVKVHQLTAATTFYRKFFFNDAGGYRLQDRPTYLGPPFDHVDVLGRKVDNTSSSTADPRLQDSAQLRR